MDAATELGKLIAELDYSLVYGGGRVGLMGCVADGCIGAGGQVRGVITDKLMQIEVAHEGLESLEVTSSMSDRRNRMIEDSDVFIVLPGGVGTLDELFEVLALTDLEYHQKRVGLLNTFGYYDHLLAFLDHATKEGFIAKECRSWLFVEDDPETLLSRLSATL
tara:strand:+ start:284 stop:772 length:489 start_codon:yes stop_codon:yes gene_type:complete